MNVRTRSEWSNGTDGSRSVKAAVTGKFHHPTKSGTVTVAGHPSDVLHPKTLATIKKQALALAADTARTLPIFPDA
jgi:hypothetical protein